jgi:flagellar L-ring protein precursor FlgH
MKPTFAAVLLGVVFLTSDTSAQQSSLWQRRDPAMTNMFADVKARRAGDLLVVKIDERSDVQNKDQRLMEKENSSASDFSANYGLTGSLGPSAAGISVGEESSAERDFRGNTKYESARQFQDQFTVTVIDTNPNGNLLISGTRHVELEGDRRTLVLTGIVRASDILPDNSISSQKVSNLDIRYATEGPNGAEQVFINQGWLGKKLNRLWPY